LFQIKATEMGPAKCATEVQRQVETKVVLKPRVADIVAKGGSYVLCYGRRCEGQHADERVAKIREGMSEVVGQELAAAVEIQVYGAEKLATWASENLSTVVFVKSCIGRSLPASLMTWGSWNTLSSSILEYRANESREAISTQLREVLSSVKGVARLAGLSGVGKSRLALELFRAPPVPHDEPIQAAFSAACVYVGDGAASSQALVDSIQTLRQERARAILVVDECPIDLHRKLETMATAPDSQISVLTLDFDPDSDPRSSACKFFRLDPLPRHDVEEMIRKGQSEVPEDHIPKVAEVAHGFPRMAQLLVEAMRGGDVHLWELAAVDVIEKLVARRSKEPAFVIRIAKSLSVLEHLGVDGSAAHELDVFARELCGESRDRVYGIVRELELAGIVYRRGDYVRVTPLPIAVSLAGEWWQQCSPERARALLLDGALSPGMVDATSNQLTRLSGNRWVEKLVASLYGPRSPFRTRELLDSARGSRLASSLAEINPGAVCGALTHVFSSLTPYGNSSN
jgi:hypothetical protein